MNKIYSFFSGVYTAWQSFADWKIFYSKEVRPSILSFLCTSVLDSSMGLPPLTGCNMPRCLLHLCYDLLCPVEKRKCQLPLGRHLLKQTRGVGPCRTSVFYFISLQGGHLSKADSQSWSRACPP